MSRMDSTSEHECEQKQTLESHGRELGKLNLAVFEGAGGQPSLKEQMAVMTQKVNALCWLVGATCVAVLTQVVALWFRTKGAA